MANERSSLWFHQAKEHWKKYLPEYYRHLEKEGTLDEALCRAVQMTSEAIVDTEDQLIRKGYTPPQANATAWEMIREEWLFPPGESTE